MPDLNFTVESAESVPFAAAPAISLKLQVTNTPPDEKIHTIALRAQIQIEATRRRYSEAEKAKLLDLFGEVVTSFNQWIKAKKWTRIIMLL